MNQENVKSLIVKHDMLNLNNEVFDSCNSSCNDDADSFLVENEVNFLSVPCDIEHNMNHVDQTGRLQNACPILQTAHFGFTKLGLSSRYKLADLSHKLLASSFEKWTLQAHEVVKRTGLPNYKGRV